MPAIIHTWLALGLSLFQRQQFFFSPDAAGIPGEASVCPNHTVAGNDNRNLVVADRTAHCLGGQIRKASFCSQLFCDGSVSGGFAVGNG